MQRFGGSQIFKCIILGASRRSYLVTFYFLCWINFPQRRGSSESKTILLLETSIPPCCKKYTLIDSTSIQICHWVIYLTWLMFENTTIHTRNGFNMYFTWICMATMMLGKSFKILSQMVVNDGNLPGTFRKKSLKQRITLSSSWNSTVDGRNLEPPDMYETL